uniref:Uncharacterized protein n=1 Tax=uncultured Prochlorococcus marinus clone HOT0M-10G7 TaxID=379385 RepID=Q1PJJ5_PROMR|nr:hypothetical protein HOT0M-10G7_0002 [uncultured Prochlorococcus marinus clone HOT0M-10G7]ABE11391.1 hypothetical protein HOT0M-10G7_0024 [uncultured Prochlorococcus marinus clone HOT0M-10G7]
MPSLENFYAPLIRIYKDLTPDKKKNQVNFLSKISV